MRLERRDPCLQRRGFHGVSELRLPNHNRLFVRCTHAAKVPAVQSVDDIDLSFKMEVNQEILKEFGKRIQRCYGCFIAYHLKDMYLGEDVTFFCEHCKDENMFHFDQFAQLLDISKLKEVAEEDHHH